MTKDLDVKDFAERVERLCKFFLAKIPEASPDRAVLEELEEAAIDMQNSGIEYQTKDAIKGLDNFMRGMPS